MSLNEALALITQHGRRASPHPACIVVFHPGHHTTPESAMSFVRPQADGTFAPRDVLGACFALN